MEKEKEIKGFRLSCSSIETYMKCSLVYHNSYIEKIRETNIGAQRGDLIHQVFEMLVKTKDRDRVKRIIDSGRADSDEEIKEMIKGFMEEVGMPEEDNKGNNNYKLICDSILVGLKYDFFFDEEGAEIDYENVERKFLIESDDPEYRLVGLIDKPAIKDNKFIIVDYKSSQSKKGKSELEFNFQTASYSLFALKVKKMKAWVRYIFVRFPDNPLDEAHCLDEDTLRGFEYFLSDVYNKLKNFSDDDKYDNLAWDKGYLPKDAGFAGRLACGRATFPGQLKKDGSTMYHCPFAFEFDYWAALDDDGKVITSSRNKSDLNKYNNIVKRHYEGCPRKTNTPEYQGWLQNNVD